jgi:ribosomal protein S18 acetylase RimI-like enzyme
VTEPTDLERAVALQRWVLEQSSNRREELAWGTAFFNDEFPLKYDANMVLADHAMGDDVSVERVSDDMDRLYDGMRHREIEIVDQAAAERLAFGMAERGYSIDRLLVMAHHREPDREPDASAVEPVDPAAVTGFHREITRREPWGKEEAVADQLAAHAVALLRAVEGTLYVQRIDGQPVGSCEVYRSGQVAQVENVNTLEEFRGRGVARNVVLTAVREAKAAGATLVFLFADEEDWPQHLYARMGFDTIGRSRVYMRVPESERPFHGEIPGA